MDQIRDCFIDDKPICTSIIKLNGNITNDYITKSVKISIPTRYNNKILRKDSIFSLTLNSGKEIITAINFNLLDDISYSSNDVFLSKFIEETANKIKMFKKQNRNASERDLNTFLNTTLKHNLVLNSASNTVYTHAITDMDGYITGRLNSQELALYNTNKALGILCMANGKVVLETSKILYNDSVLYNGNGDAFRHIFWNYAMTIDIGAVFAKKWSDAH